MKSSSSFYKKSESLKKRQFLTPKKTTYSNFGEYSEQRLKKLDQIGFQHQAKQLRKDYSNSYRFKELKHRERATSVKQLLSKTNRIISKSGNFLEPTKIISVTGSKWALFNYYKNRYVRGYRAHDTHQLSVFSKLLVFATVNTLVNKYEIDISRFQMITTETVLQLYKTNKRCLLKKDDVVTLQNMLYLMLMESGEQYELIIAINIGAYLQKKRKKQYYSVFDAEDRLFKQHVQQFYDYVNSYCQLMNLQNIKYLEYEPTLKRQKNKCSAFDVATLSIQCLKIPLFQKIMKAHEALITVKYVDDLGNISYSDLCLKSKTIENPFISYYNVCRNWGDNFMNSICSVYYQQQGLDPIIVVIIGSYNPTDRQKDIQQIIEWYVKKWQQKQKNRLIKQAQNKQQEKLINQLREGIKRNKKKHQQKLQEQEEYEFEEMPKINNGKNKPIFNSFSNKNGSYRIKTQNTNQKYLPTNNNRLRTQITSSLQMIVQEKLKTKR